MQYHEIQINIRQCQSTEHLCCDEADCISFREMAQQPISELYQWSEVIDCERRMARASKFLVLLIQNISISITQNIRVSQSIHLSHSKLIHQIQQYIRSHISWGWYFRDAQSMIWSSWTEQILQHISWIQHEYSSFHLLVSSPSMSRKDKDISPIIAYQIFHVRYYLILFLMCWIIVYYRLVGSL